MSRAPRYAELQVTSHFNFLRGASSCEEMFSHAASLGIAALAVVDRNSLAGIVRAYEAAKATGVRLIVGCRLDLADGTSVLVYPIDRPAYARLCRLLSLGKKRGGKARCQLDWSDLVAYGEGLIAILVPDQADESCALALRRLHESFGDRAYMALTLRRRPNDQLRLHDLANLATQMRIPAVVTNDVLFHEPGRRILQDVVTCIRHNVTIDELGHRRERHADRYLKPPDEIHRLFSRYSEALDRTIEIMERCRFSLDELAYQYPEERLHPELTTQETLEKLTWEGAAERYPEGVPDSVRTSLEHELRLIEKLQYAPYFLTVNSIVRFARSKDILCQGRGSAANSAVCDEICERFFRSLPTIEPTAQSVSDQGKLLFADFPARSTIHNSDDGYAEILRIWRDAYLHLVTDFPTVDNHQHVSSPQGDRGYRAELDLYLSVIKSQKLELDRLRRIMDESGPAPMPGGGANGESAATSPPQDIVGLRPIRKWISDLGRPGGPLEINEVGVMISRAGRPGRVVMETEVVDALRSL